MGADTQFGIHPDFWANNKHPVFCKPNGLWTGHDNRIEMWRIVHHGLPAHLASKQEDTLHGLGLTDKEILALAAGLVTFKMTTWINSVLMQRRRQFSTWSSGNQGLDIDRSVGDPSMRGMLCTSFAPKELQWNLVLSFQ